MVASCHKWIDSVRRASMSCGRLKPTMIYRPDRRSIVIDALTNAVF